MSTDGTVDAFRVWKRFRTDAQRWSVKTQAQYALAHLRGDTDDFWRWALRDVTVHIEPGEAVGLVGPNGSGKSTLLKVLTRVMRPYAGRVEVSGRVGALIQVTAGIQNELTGRENIYLYGTIMGLTRPEVTRHFDEIVAFGELEEAVDRQVKFYSSGMQMRLGFAVMAFLDPAVLLVDEVLAVGDAAFQQRCLNRMRDVLNSGTTLILVSHDLASVESICKRCLFLHDGVLQADGPARDVLGAYRTWIETMAEALRATPGLVRLLKVGVHGVEGDSPRTEEPLQVRLVLDNPRTQETSIFVGISEGPATPIFVLRRTGQLAAGQQEVRCNLAHLPLPEGAFWLWVGVFDRGRRNGLLPWHPAARFDVVGPKLMPAPAGVVRLSPVHVEANWDVGAA
jgi:ABC-type polysaccharide/polyol phosphate transport system ATPase subunit